jgi:hypothetical protein
MAYIGNQIRQYSDRVVLDSLTASATANYTLQLNGSNYVPSSAESLTVSLNGVIQKPQNSYTVSGSTLSFASALTASDSIDFVIAERGITLQTPSAGSVNTEQLASNAVTPAKLNLNDNLLFNTASKGIYLGVTSATASNLLDDYEEGTWTPEFGGTTTDPSVVYEVGFTKGGYVKIGRQVTISGQIRTSAGTTGGTGSLTLKNLPFSTSKIGSERGYAGNVIIYGIDTPVNTLYVSLFNDTSENNTRFTLACSIDNTVWQFVNASTLGSVDIIFFTATYFTT